jgi:glycosyltransferase involved in cell wall biosynthesis
MERSEARAARPERSVLMIAYYYPPLGGIGSLRSQKFARHLPAHGWRPIVLTPQRARYFVDRDLDDGTSSGVEVVRTPFLDLSSALRGMLHVARPTRSPEIARPDDFRAVEGGAVVEFLRRAVRTWLYVPDGQIGWLPHAVRAGLASIRAGNVDAIYSTSFPVTSHLVARRLKRRSGLPWVADFRDLWTENHYDDCHSRLRKRLDRSIERKLLSEADVLVTVSETWAETLRRLSGGRRVVVIRNGFDPADFANDERPDCEPWTVTHVGNFYGDKQDPTPIFAALARLMEQGKIPRAEVRIKLVGPRDDYVERQLERSGIADLVEATGFVSHEESVRHQMRSHLLLLVMRAGDRSRGHLPGKLFEYLGARRPILALVPANYEAARIIRETAAGTAVDPSDDRAIEQCLLDSFERRRSGAYARVPACDLSAYERQSAARRLADLFTEIIEPAARVAANG